MMLQFTRGALPGDFVILRAYKKDQRMENLTLSAIPRVAPPLPLNYNPDLHAPVQQTQASPILGVVHNAAELQVRTEALADRLACAAMVLQMSRAGLNHNAAPFLLLYLDVLQHAACVCSATCGAAM
jgi:hypothetical protein